MLAFVAAVLAVVNGIPAGPIPKQLAINPAVGDLEAGADGAEDLKGSASYGYGYYGGGGLSQYGYGLGYSHGYNPYSYSYGYPGYGYYSCE